jgi:predicted O-methyltransferase YrrM
VELDYWNSAGRALVRRLRDKDFVKLWLSFGLITEKWPQARTTHMLLAYPELADWTVSMGNVTFRPYNLDPAEQYCLAALTQLRKPQRIFEFGTYDGASTLLLARAAPDADLFTLDLPPELLGRVGGSNEEQHELAGGVGARFRDQPEESRITQLLCDSREFDPGPFEASMDLVLVDGSHAYDGVRADSESAVRMLAPGGIVVWDDYMAHFPDVIKGVDDAAAEHEFQVVHLEPTDFAVYDPSLAPILGTPMRGWGA